MGDILIEGNLQFDFSLCPLIRPIERFDSEQSNVYGMKAVDFFAETHDSLLFIEVKDFQNPNAHEIRRRADYEMLKVSSTLEQSLFVGEMGQKLKDSLLRKYAIGEKNRKEGVLLIVH
jgi:hypothetical protein